MSKCSCKFVSLKVCDILHYYQIEPAYSGLAVRLTRKVVMKAVPGALPLFQPVFHSPGTNFVKLFAAVIYDFCNKLECLSLPGLSEPRVT